MQWVDEHLLRPLQRKIFKNVGYYDYRRQTFCVNAAHINHLLDGAGDRTKRRESKRANSSARKEEHCDTRHASTPAARNTNEANGSFRGDMGGTDGPDSAPFSSHATAAAAAGDTSSCPPAPPHAPSQVLLQTANGKIRLAKAEVKAAGLVPFLRRLTGKSLAVECVHVVLDFAHTHGAALDTKERRREAPATSPTAVAEELPTGAASAAAAATGMTDWLESEDEEDRSSNSSDAFAPPQEADYDEFEDDIFGAEDAVDGLSLHVQQRDGEGEEEQLFISCMSGHGEAAHHLLTSHLGGESDEGSMFASAVSGQQDSSLLSSPSPASLSADALPSFTTNRGSPTMAEPVRPKDRSLTISDLLRYVKKQLQGVSVSVEALHATLRIPPRGHSLKPKKGGGRASRAAGGRTDPPPSSSPPTELLPVGTVVIHLSCTGGVHARIDHVDNSNEDFAASVGVGDWRLYVHRVENTGDGEGAALLACNGTDSANLSTATHLFSLPLEDLVLAATACETTPPTAASSAEGGSHAGARFSHTVKVAHVTTASTRRRDARWGTSPPPPPDPVADAARSASPLAEKRLYVTARAARLTTVLTQAHLSHLAEAANTILGVLPKSVSQWEAPDAAGGAAPVSVKSPPPPPPWHQQEGKGGPQPSCAERGGATLPATHVHVAAPVVVDLPPPARVTEGEVARRKTRQEADLLAVASRKMEAATLAAATGHVAHSTKYLELCLPALSLSLVTARDAAAARQAVGAAWRRFLLDAPPLPSAEGSREGDGGERAPLHEALGVPHLTVAVTGVDALFPHVDAEHAFPAAASGPGEETCHKQKQAVMRNLFRNGIADPKLTALAEDQHGLLHGDGGNALFTGVRSFCVLEYRGLGARQEPGATAAAAEERGGASVSASPQQAHERSRFQPTQLLSVQKTPYALVCFARSIPASPTRAGTPADNEGDGASAVDVHEEFVAVVMGTLRVEMDPDLFVVVARYLSGLGESFARRTAARGNASAAPHGRALSPETPPSCASSPLQAAGASSRTRRHAKVLADFIDGRIRFPIPERQPSQQSGDAEEDFDEEYGDVADMGGRPLLQRLLRHLSAKSRRYCREATAAAAGGAAPRGRAPSSQASPREVTNALCFSHERGDQPRFLAEGLHVRLVGAQLTFTPEEEIHLQWREAVGAIVDPVDRTPTVDTGARKPAEAAARTAAPEPLSRSRRREKERNAAATARSPPPSRHESGSRGSVKELLRIDYSEDMKLHVCHSDLLANGRVALRGACEQPARGTPASCGGGIPLPTSAAPPPAALRRVLTFHIQLGEVVTQPLTQDDVRLTLYFAKVLKGGLSRAKRVVALAAKERVRAGSVPNSGASEAARSAEGAAEGLTVPSSSPLQGAEERVPAPPAGMPRGDVGGASSAVSVSQLLDLMETDEGLAAALASSMQMRDGGCPSRGGYDDRGGPPHPSGQQPPATFPFPPPPPLPALRFPLSSSNIGLSAEGRDAAAAPHALAWQGEGGEHTSNAVWWKDGASATYVLLSIRRVTLKLLAPRLSPQGTPLGEPMARGLTAAVAANTDFSLLFHRYELSVSRLAVAYLCCDDPAFLTAGKRKRGEEEARAKGCNSQDGVPLTELTMEHRAAAAATTADATARDDVLGSTMDLAVRAASVELAEDIPSCPGKPQMALVGRVLLVQSYTGSGCSSGAAPPATASSTRADEPLSASSARDAEYILADPPLCVPPQSQGGARDGLAVDRDHVCRVRLTCRPTSTTEKATRVPSAQASDEVMMVDIDFRQVGLHHLPAHMGDAWVAVLKNFFVDRRSSAEEAARRASEGKPMSPPLPADDEVGETLDVKVSLRAADVLWAYRPQGPKKPLLVFLAPHLVVDVTVPDFTGNPVMTVRGKFHQPAFLYLCGDCDAGELAEGVLNQTGRGWGTDLESYGFTRLLEVRGGGTSSAAATAPKASNLNPAHVAPAVLVTVNRAPHQAKPVQARVSRLHVSAFTARDSLHAFFGAVMPLVSLDDLRWVELPHALVMRSNAQGALAWVGEEVARNWAPMSVRISEALPDMLFGAEKEPTLLGSGEAQRGGVAYSHEPRRRGYLASFPSVPSTSNMISADFARAAAREDADAGTTHPRSTEAGRQAPGQPLAVGEVMAGREYDDGGADDSRAECRRRMRLWRRTNAPKEVVLRRVYEEAMHELLDTAWPPAPQAAARDGTTSFHHETPAGARTRREEEEEGEEWMDLLLTDPLLWRRRNALQAAAHARPSRASWAGGAAPNRRASHDEEADLIHSASTSSFESVSDNPMAAPTVVWRVPPPPGRSLSSPRETAASPLRFDLGEAVALEPHYLSGFLHEPESPTITQPLAVEALSLFLPAPAPSGADGGHSLPKGGATASAGRRNTTADRSRTDASAAGQLLPPEQRRRLLPPVEVEIFLHGCGADISLYDGCDLVANPAARKTRRNFMDIASRSHFNRPSVPWSTSRAPSPSPGAVVGGTAADTAGPAKRGPLPEQRGGGAERMKEGKAVPGTATATTASVDNCSSPTTPASPTTEQDLARLHRAGHHAGLGQRNAKKRLVLRLRGVSLQVDMFAFGAEEQRWLHLVVEQATVFDCIAKSDVRTLVSASPSRPGDWLQTSRFLELSWLNLVPRHTSAVDPNAFRIEGGTSAGQEGEEWRRPPSGSGAALLYGNPQEEISIRLRPVSVTWSGASLDFLMHLVSSDEDSGGEAGKSRKTGGSAPPLAPPDMFVPPPLYFRSFTIYPTVITLSGSFDSDAGLLNAIHHGDKLDVVRNLPLLSWISVQRLPLTIPHITVRDCGTPALLLEQIIADSECLSIRFLLTVCCCVVQPLNAAAKVGEAARGVLLAPMAQYRRTDSLYHALTRAATTLAAELVSQSARVGSMFTNNTYRASRALLEALIGPTGGGGSVVPSHHHSYRGGGGGRATTSSLYSPYTPLGGPSGASEGEARSAAAAAGPASPLDLYIDPRDVSFRRGTQPSTVSEGVREGQEAVASAVRDAVLLASYSVGPDGRLVRLPAAGLRVLMGLSDGATSALRGIRNASNPQGTTHAPERPTHPSDTPAW